MSSLLPKLTLLGVDGLPLNLPVLEARKDKVTKGTTGFILGSIMGPLLLLLLLFFVWLMIRLGRKSGTAGPSVGLKVARSLLLLIALILGLVYCWFRIERSRADVERSRKTARELVETMDRYNAEKGVVSAFVGGDVYNSVETLVDVANDGDPGRLQQAALDARYSTRLSYMS